MNNPAKITQIITEMSIWCDGGSRGNPGPGACAFVAKNQIGELLNKEKLYIGVTTNNIAEYKAVLLALEWIKNKYRSININYNFFIDSRLVVSQLNGIFKIKDSSLRELLLKIKIIENEIEGKIKYSLIPREKNHEADILVNEVMNCSL